MLSRLTGSARRRSRCSALLTLLLHLLVVGAGPLADARLEARADGAHAPVHVEDADSPACDAGHQHEFCLICRALQSFDAPPAGSAAPFVAESPRRRALSAPRTFLPASCPLSPLGPRGPPAV